MTGVEFWPVTRPGFVQGNLVLAASAAGVMGVPMDASGTGKWANLANITSNNVSNAHGTGGPTDKSFIPIASGVNSQNTGTSFPHGGWGSSGCSRHVMCFAVY